MRLSKIRKFRSLSAVLFTALSVGIAAYAYAVTLTSAAEKAVVTMLVMPSLQIEKYSELTFRAARPGAQAEVISPRARGGAGGIKVVGFPNQAYTVFFPKAVDLVGTNPERSVKVTDFTSYPEAGSGLLGTHGQLENKVGATRNELEIDLPSGNYEGNYTLTVAFP